VLEQTYRHLEIIVVDDGSADDSALISARYPAVKLIQQENRGLSAARNAGVEAGTGDYLVFLDADDRLCRDALTKGVDCLGAHPESAFVYGAYTLIATDGQPMASSQRKRAPEDTYLNLLRSNYIGMHATVMYRRAAFEFVQRFNTSLAACEDYDLFLRIARIYPIHGHGQVVAEYRQHGSNMSRNPELMLKSSLSVLGSQWKYVRANRQARVAYREGIENWQACYGDNLLKSLRSRAQAREWTQLAREVLVLLRHYPRGILSKLSKKFLQITARAPKLFSIGPLR
jgi:glycosyltransferase involved in cell wall biosynthesis